MRRRFRLLLIWSLLLVVVAATLYLTNRERIYGYRFKRAEQSFEQGDYQAAAGQFQAVQQGFPRFSRAPEALFTAGEILNLFLNRHQEALLAYLLLVRDYPQSAWATRARLQAALIYKNRLHDYGQALTLLQKAIDVGIDGADRVQYQIADCYFLLNNFEQARIEFESLEKSFPDSPLLAEVRFRIGMTQAFEKNYPSAAASFRRVLTVWPESRFALEAKFQLAAVLIEQERLREALEQLQQLRGHYPNEQALQQRIERVEERISKKKKAI